MTKGFVAISTVLILLVVVVSIVTTVSLLSIGETQSAFAVVKGESSLQFTEGCVEDVLLRVRSDESYASGTLSYPDGLCTVDISREGDVWTLNVRSNAVDYVRNIRVVFIRAVTGVTLISWKEIP